MQTWKIVSSESNNKHLLSYFKEIPLESNKNDNKSLPDYVY